MPGVKFTHITEQHDRIAIVASGPSAKGFRAPSGVTVIAVNGAIEWLGRADYWFTLDPGHRNWARMLNRRAGTDYLAAVPSGFGTPRAPLPVMRQPAPSGVRYLRRITGNWILSAKPGLSENPAQIHTGNSAYGALGLAYLFGARRIALFGIDASRAQRIEGGRSNSLAHLPALFASAVPQLERSGIDVVTASLGSQVDCFRKMAQEDALRWLTADM
jgi:hypothetical protein